MPVTKKKLTTLVAAINQHLARDDRALLFLGEGPQSCPYRIGAGGDLDAPPQRLTPWLSAHDCYTWLNGFLAACLHAGCATTQADATACRRAALPE